METATAEYMRDVWVVVPAYNEGQAITRVLAELTRLPYKIVVVDDGSTDDTVARVRQFPVHLLRHICNLGQGAAIQTGITYSLQQPGARFVVTFDSDGQHQTEDIARILHPLQVGTHQVTLGSRFAPGGAAVDISAVKRLTLWLATVFTRLTTGLRLTDTHNGLRGFTATSAGQLNITQNRMAHASEILNRIAALRLSYTEVPVTVTYTSYSTSKGQSIFQALNIVWDSTISRWW